ncbi:unnamed protein product, partial [Brassica rapa]
QTAHVGQNHPNSPRKGQRAEFKDQPTDVLCVLTDTHGRPVWANGQPQTATDILCVLADTNGRPVCTEQTAPVGQNHPNSPREGPAC